MKPRLRAIVQKNLLDGVSARVKELDRGGYTRVYRSGGTGVPDGLHALVSRILDAAGVEYGTDVPLFAGSTMRADFAVGDRLIVVGEDLSAEERKEGRPRREEVRGDLAERIAQRRLRLRDAGLAGRATARTGGSRRFSSTTPRSTSTMPTSSPGPRSAP